MFPTALEPLARQETGGHSQEFSLDEDTRAEVVAVPGLALQRWQELSHCRERRRFFVLVAGETLRLPRLRIGPVHVLELSFMPGLPSISSDGLTVDVHITSATRANPQVLLSSPLLAVEGMDLPRTLRLSLDEFAGEDVLLEIKVGAGRAGDPLGDWLALDQVTVASAERLSLIAARSNFRWRAVNELAHFAQVYKHAIYHADAERPRGDVSPRWIAMARTTTASLADDRAVTALRQCRDIAPAPQENANSYAHRVLGELIRRPPPSFPARLQAIARSGPLRILSICSGAARIEAQILAAVDFPVELTLVDINRGLLEEAAARMPQHVSASLIEADANRLVALPQAFDLAICVSGLHHLIEIESVLSAIAGSLRDGGEFWSIGEQVGRNGNRLWPGDYDVANQLFSRLDARYRKNRNTSVVDSTLPNFDCSAGCFEGIRSEDLLDAIDRFFVREDVYLRNCFLWRLVDLAYVDNYHLGRADDLATLRSLVVAEYLHWRDGGRAVELHGAFVKK